METNSDGQFDFSVDSTMRKATFLWPPSSTEERDGKGNVIYLFATNEDGEPILDSNGAKVPLLDEKGKPVPKMTPEPEEQNELWIRYLPINRRLRQEAMDASIMEHMKQTGEPGVLISVMESYLVNRCVRASNMKGIPGKGFDNLKDARLGDEIVSQMKIWEQLSGQTAVESGKGNSGKEQAVESLLQSTPTAPQIPTLPKK